MVRWMIAGGLLLLLGSLGAMACGRDDKPLTLTQFFAKWEEVNNDGKAKVQTLNARFPRAFKNDVQQTKDYYAEYVKIFDEADTGLKDIAAPEEARSVVGEILDTEAKMSIVHHHRLDGLGDVTTGEELNVLFVPNQDYEALVRKDADLCGQLVQLANDYHILYDAPCGR